MGGVSDVESSGRMFTHTVGVDLSVVRRRTAVVAIEWGERSATVGGVVVGPSDEELVAAIVGGEWVGISAPFGWPREMVAAVHSYSMVGEWPVVGKEAFRYRCTDLCVHEYLVDELGRRVWPLSVSSDGLALTAWRMGRLREEVASRSGVKFDRSGADGVVEVFPGASLLMWGFERGVYRRGDLSGEDEVKGAREEFVSGLEAVAPWLRWSGDSRELCVQSEDVVDAVICALTARAAELGRVVSVPDHLAEQARSEGWVYLPDKGCLRELVGAVVGVGEV